MVENLIAEGVMGFIKLPFDLAQLLEKILKIIDEE